MKKSIILLLCGLFIVQVSFGQNALQAQNNILIKDILQKIQNNDLLPVSLKYFTKKKKSQQTKGVVKQRLDSTINQAIEPFLEGERSKSMFLFNENAKNTVMLSQTWDTTKHQWKNNTKNEYEFNQAGYLIRDISQNWNPNLNVWEKEEKIEYTYIDFNLSEEHTTLWDEEVEIWLDLSVKSYAYDDSGRPAEMIYKTWSNYQWVNNTQDIYQYKEDKLEVLYHNQWVESEWRNQQKDIYTYDTEGKPITVLTKMWNINDTTWEDQIRFTFTYDAFDNVSEILIAMPIQNIWIDIAKEILEYNTDFYTYQLALPVTFTSEDMIPMNNMLVGLKLYMIDDTFAWKEVLKTNAFYSSYEFNFIAHERTFNLLVYPNPASEFIVFDIVDKSSLEIFDLQGHIVLERKIAKGEKVNIEKLCQGVYFYKIQNNNNIHTGKFVKK
jgi:hypothetical protein